MTPFNFSGFISHVWFKGVPGAATFLTGELDRPVTLAADFVDPDDAYVLEAFIPWRVFELEGPPDHDLTALFALFDNDGEEVEGRPIQRTILANVPGAEFQQPHTWGRLSFEPS